ncbi:MAG: hypothetical protein FWD27_07940 [Coriobacteriia bacterium]|nr:hypothetical protein [Coriobacteriia bacterium]
MDDIANTKELYFSIKDTVQETQINLGNLSLPLISEFTEAVSRFIKGSTYIDLSEVRVVIEEGSLAIAVRPSPVIMPAITDFESINTSGNLDEIDSNRAKVIAELQDKARSNPNRTYTISDTSDRKRIDGKSIVISNKSDYRKTLEDQWVQTETYIYGKVFDIGGKTKSNVHLTLENGSTVKLDADAGLLADDSENRLYKEQLVRVKAEQNLRTKEYRKETLVSFEKYAPHFDEAEYQKLSAKVKSVWADVSDIVSWVEEARGNYA